MHCGGENTPKTPVDNFAEPAENPQPPAENPQPTERYTIYDFNNINKKQNAHVRTTSENRSQTEDAQFCLFWDLFPNDGLKNSREFCFKKFQLLSDVDKRHAISGLQKQMVERGLKAKYGLFVPNLKSPANWLQQRSWEDEVLSENQIKQKYEAARAQIKHNKYKDSHPSQNNSCSPYPSREREAEIESKKRADKLYKEAQERLEAEQWQNKFEKFKSLYEKEDVRLKFEKYLKELPFPMAKCALKRYEHGINEVRVFYIQFCEKYYSDAI